MGVETGDSADSISGIQRTGDYSMRVVATEVAANMVYQLAVYIAPLHYYGDESKYDYENNKFGFDKGDPVQHPRKDDQAPGAGAYTFKDYSNGTVYLEANPNYYKGEPKIKNVNFLETLEDDKVTGIEAVPSTSAILPTPPTYVIRSPSTTAATTAWMATRSPLNCTTSWAMATLP